MNSFLVVNTKTNLRPHPKKIIYTQLESKKKAF